MSYDRAKLEQAIRAGDPLPNELLDIFKQDAARRRSAKIDVRLQKVAQQLREVAQAGKPSPLTPSQQRFRRSQPGFPPGRRYSASPPPPPPPLACMAGWKMIGDTSAPFSWGSSETAQLGPAIPDGAAHQWSVMTRQHTGEFSLALAVDSDPNSPYSPTTNEVLGFKGVTLSATIGQLYFVPGSPLVLQAQARLAMNEFPGFAFMMRLGDAYAVTEGSATLTVSQFAVEFTEAEYRFSGFQTKLLGQSSTEADLFLCGAEPDASKFFENQANFDGSPFDLSATLPNNEDATFTKIDVDIQLFAAVTPGIPNGTDPALIYLDFRIDDDDLIVGPEAADGSYPGLLPYPSPILLKETRLCSYSYP